MDAHKGAAAARAIFVQDAGDEFLSRAALPADQHRRLAARHLANGFKHAVDCRALALQLAAVEIAGLGGGFGRGGITDLRQLRLQDGNLTRLRFDPFDLADQLVIETLQIAIAFHRVKGHVRDLPERVQKGEILSAERGRVLLGAEDDESHHLVADLEPVHEIDAQFPQRILGRRGFPAGTEECVAGCPDPRPLRSVDDRR